MVEFVGMARTEAKEYLAGFLDEMDAGLRRVIDEAAASGGPAPEEWDLTPAALALVWEWAVPRLSWRPGYEPPALGMPGPRIAADQLEPLDQLPSWFHHPSAASYADFSAETLWLIDGIGRYLGQTVLATVPGTSWAAGHSRNKGYMFQNQPVIRGLADEKSPFHTPAILVSKVLAPVGRDIRTLRDVYEIWTSQAVSPSRRSQRIQA